MVTVVLKTALHTGKSPNGVLGFYSANNQERFTSPQVR